MMSKDINEIMLLTTVDIVEYHTVNSRSQFGSDIS